MSVLVFLTKFVYSDNNTISHTFTYTVSLIPKTSMRETRAIVVYLGLEKNHHVLYTNEVFQLEKWSNSFPHHNSKKWKSRQRSRSHFAKQTHRKIWQRFTGSDRNHVMLLPIYLKKYLIDTICQGKLSAKSDLLTS